MRNQQNVKVRVNSSFETICPFPVGYVYMSSNSTSPGSIYGGTWASISGGRYMRAAGAWGNGGSNTITVQQMPAHSHGYLQYFWRVYEPATGWNTSQYMVAHTDKTSSPISSGTSEFGTASTGGGSILSYVPKRLGVVQNCLKKVNAYA